MPPNSNAEKRQEIATSVSELAEHLLIGGELIRFRERAKAEFDSLALSDPAALRPFFHNPPPESPHYDVATDGLGTWLSCCQFAVFELIFNFGEDSLPFLRKIAWGEYDWTQGNAIELMIRLAADGVATEFIIAEIETEFPNIRYEASVYAIQPLIPQLDSDPNLKRVFKRLLSIAYFKEAYDELTFVDPDRYGIEDEQLHAIVTSIRRSNLDAFGQRIVATLEVEGLTSFGFQETGGVGCIYVSSDCILVKSTENGAFPISLDDALKSHKIAIGHFGTSFVRDRRTCVCPASIAVIEGETS